MQERNFNLTVPCKIRYSFIRWMARSTCIRASAMRRVLVTSFADNWVR